MQHVRVVWAILLSQRLCVGSIRSLFSNFLQPHAIDSGQFVPCERAILQHFNSLTNVTGARAYETSESAIQLCPNLCDNSTTVHGFCEANEPDYIKAFLAKVQSDRCCDARHCQCVCQFQCHTFATKESEFKAEGFKDCTWASHKSDLLAQSRRICQTRRNELDCSQNGMNFLCSRQYICIGDTCLACMNPNCVSKLDKKMTKFLIQNHTQITHPRDEE